jgi:hypothetical protein
MNTELTYLLEELEKWDPEKPIKVKDLKEMIENAFEQEGKDEDIINNFDYESD